MNEIDLSFVKASQILPLIHILAVIFLVCAVVCMILIARIFMKNGQVKFNAILSYLKGYERFFVLFLLCICASGFAMSQGSDFKFSDPMIKGVLATLWTGVGFIVLNFAYMHYKISSLKRALSAGDEFEANEHLIIIVRYFIPLNLAISLFCVYLGVTIGEF